MRQRFVRHEMPKRTRRRGFVRLFESLWVAGVALGVGGVAVGMMPGDPPPPPPATPDDFVLNGTQPGEIIAYLSSAYQVCAACHGFYPPEIEEQSPFDRWTTSLMAQSARDPIFHACLSIAEQDLPGSGEMCLRCHAPMGWLQGRSTPSDGSGLDPQFGDFEGVSCSICHRMVDPIYSEGQSPAEDLIELTMLSTGVPPNPGSANYVIDRYDRRRGPHDLDADWGGFFFHAFLESPFHQSSRLCATCHEVSNPAYERQMDGTYALSADGMPHPTQDKYDMFPLERTFSEWEQSLFGQGPVELGGRFGGSITAVSSCQDCHMPDTTGEGCGVGPPIRTDLPVHNFNGSNSWVLRAIHATYFESETGLSDTSVDDAVERNLEMLRRAGDLEAVSDGSEVTARITNFTGHKLPTGYNEGRMMWLNVRFLDGQGGVIDEIGAYDPGTGAVDRTGAKVYEAKFGISPDVAAATGRPAGEGFHFTLNNVLVFDNRIPPMGFTNAAFESVQAGPVAYSYADGQYWDDTSHAIPFGTARVELNVYHQTTTKEYIEFLRDENDESVGDPENPSTGEHAYDLWVDFGRSAPVLMDTLTIRACPCDWNEDGAKNTADFFEFFGGFFGTPADADFNGDGATDTADFFEFFGCFFGPACL